MESTASTDPAAAPLSPGDPRALGPYEVLGRLGSGGMGTVYLGRGTDGARVAIKVVRSDLASDEGFLARFRWEVEAARRVAPFCTAPVLGADLDADPPYLVTEYVPGPRLDQAVGRDGPLPPSGLTGFAVGVAAALTAIHGVGLVHRDLKPSNVLLSAYGPRVIDFGIARALDAASTLTAHGVPVGTPGWMAPEQLDGGRVTPAADVFLWGALVAYAGSGRQPFGQGSRRELAERVLAPPDLDALEPGLRRIVAAAMDPDPARRPSAKGLLLALLGGTAPADQHEAVTQVLERTWIREEPRADTRIATPPPRPRAAPNGGATLAAPPPRGQDRAPGGWPAPSGPAGWPAPVPVAARRPRWPRRLLIGVAVLIAVLWLLDRLPDTTTAAAPGATATPTTSAEAPTAADAADAGPAGEAPAPVPPAAVSDVGRTVTDGRFAFVVAGVVCGQESLGEGLGEKQAQGQFCTLSLQVTNVSDAPQTLHSGEQELLDAQGRRYRADGGVNWIVDSELDLWTDVNPGNAVSGTLSYDLPEGVQPVAVELHDSPFSGGVVADL